MSLRITDKKALQQLVDAGRLDESVFKSLSGSKRSKVNRVTGDRLSPLVPEKPSDKLYQALVRRYGRYHSGGLMV
jgi:hypothetical protein